MIEFSGAPATFHLLKTCLPIHAEGPIATRQLKLNKRRAAFTILSTGMGTYNTH